MPLLGRCGAPVAAIWVVLCGPLLPREHVHRAGIEGRTTLLAHAHRLERFASADSDISVAESHGDHSLALFLTTVYDTASREVAPRPVMTMEAAPSVVLHLQTVHGVAAPSTQTTHGPPRSAWLTRGPPFFC